MTPLEHIGADAPWLWPLPSVGARAPLASSKFGELRGTEPHLGVDLTYRRTPADPPLELDPSRGSRGFYTLDVPALAAQRGRVVGIAGMEAKNGGQVVLEHGNGWWSFYSHLRSLLVRNGADVARGQQLGLVGAPVNRGQVWRHLHFELRKGRHQADAIDPAPYMAGWQVLDLRLVPRAPAAASGLVALAGLGILGLGFLAAAVIA